MCFSATANFVGSGVLGTVGVVTLTKVKHRRELLFASLPTLFAVHQFTEGFVWLGLDGVLSPTVTHNMGAAFMLYAQGLLPFLAPLSVMLFEPTRERRRGMLPFVVIGGATALYVLWGLTAYPTDIYVRDNSIVYINHATNNMAVAVLYVIATCGSLFFLEDQDDGCLWSGKPGNSLDCRRGQAICLYLGVVRLRGNRQCHHPCLLLEKQQTPAIPLRTFLMRAVAVRSERQANPSASNLLS